MCHHGSVFYAIGLSEKVRARVEKVERLQMDDVERAMLVRTKIAHTVLIFLAVVIAVPIQGFYPHVGFYILGLLFLAGGITEAFIRSTSPKQTLARARKTFRAWLPGLIVWMGLLTFATI